MASWLRIPFPPSVTTSRVSAWRRVFRWIWSSAAYRHGTELAALSWSLDLQHHVLLHLRNAAGLGWWVWLERDRAPADWQALREALVAWREAQRQGQRNGH